MNEYRCTCYDPLVSTTRRSALAIFIHRRLAERDESLEHFANRNGINASGLGRFLRGVNRSLHRDTAEKVAIGLGMTHAEMISLAEGEVAYRESPSQAEVLARVPELEEVLRGLPPSLWGTVLRFTVESTRAFASGLVIESKHALHAAPTTSEPVAV